MKPRLEPLLWLQCLALGTIPLELLLIRLVLAGADPGPVPPVERLLVWAMGALAPAAALWKRPADWGSLLLVRVPLKERDQEQQALSAKLGGLISRTSVAVAAIGSLPLLWWLDDSAVLASEFSPVLGQSRLVTLLISIPLLALMVWQVQQLSRALGWLLPNQSQPDQAASPQTSASTDQQHTSFGLQILRLNRLTWPEQAPKPPPRPTPTSEPISAEPIPAEIDQSDAAADDRDEAIPTDKVIEPERVSQPSIVEPNSHENENSESNGIESEVLESKSLEASAVDIEDNGEEHEEIDSAEEEASEETSNDVNVEQLKNNEATIDDPSNIEGDTKSGDREITMDAPSAVKTETPVEELQDDSSVGVSSSIEVKESEEESESSSLDPEVTELNSVTSGSAEEHREQTESGGSEQGTPNEPPQATPGGQ